MEANELMIGDWVYNKNIDKPMQVYPTMFSQMFRTRPDATTEDYNIFPIPLTVEILKKNGFVVEPEYCFGEPLQYCEIADGLWIYISGENYVEGKLGYVHELQRALRLCGIDKEIVL